MKPLQKILVVDDSAVERFHMTAMLSKQGHTVIEAIDGADALAKAKSYQPDLILMDVVMPGMNGFQITRQLSRDDSLKHIPVVLCTSKDAETDKVWGMRQGAKGYLTKPVSATALFAMMTTLASAANTQLPPN
jgi:twitching motility two-component system response regulator PilH